MKLHKLIAGGLVTAMFALQAWTLTSIIDLKVEVAVVKQQVSTLTKTQIANERHHANSLTVSP